MVLNSGGILESSEQFLINTTIQAHAQRCRFNCSSVCQITGIFQSSPDKNNEQPVLRTTGLGLLL